MARVKKKKLSLEELLEQALVKKEDQPYKVPSNWSWIHLGSLLKPMTTQKPNKDEEFFKYIDIEVIDNKRQRISKPKTILVKDAPSRAARELSYGDTLFSLVRPYLKNIAFVEEGYEKCIASTGFYVCKPQSIVYPLYLYNLLCSEYVVNTLNQFMKGDNSPSIKGGDIEICKVPLPPLAEQQRIVGRIESLFEKLDTAKELAQNALDSFENRKAAILHKAFTGELTAKWRKENYVSLDSWEEKKFASLGKLERGRSKHRPRNAKELFGGEYPFIQTGDVANADTYVREHKQTLSEFGLAQSRLFPKGTLCITIAANIGDVAILTYDCCFPDSVVGFTPNETTDSKYIYYYMSVIKKEVEANAPSTAQKNINLKILNDIKIKVPTIEEQKEMVRIIDKVFEEERQARELCDVIEKIDLMKKTILTRAFRGELGTNNPEEESTIELLKEVLKEKL